MSESAVPARCRDELNQTLLRTFALHMSRSPSMHRRLITAALAVTLASPVLAQNQNPVSPIPVTPQGTNESRTNEALGANAQQREQRTTQGGAPQDSRTPSRQGGAQAGASGGSPTAADGQQQSQADRQHVTQTLAAGTVSLQSSNFAITKAQNPRVKRFAEFEIGEQNTLADVLHSFAEPSTTASTGAKQAAATAPVLSQQASAMMERLSRAQAGPAFDRDYVAGQIQGHGELLAIQERYLQSASTNRELIAIAQMARNSIREHLALLQQIQGELGQ
jgi:putative membrane protein